MQKNTFSKRKTKFAGLCGAILATTTIAMGVGATVHADEASATSATDTAAQTSKTADTKQDQPTFENTPVDTSAQNQDTALTSPAASLTATADQPAQTNQAQQAAPSQATTSATPVQDAAQTASQPATVAGGSQNGQAEQGQTADKPKSATTTQPAPAVTTKPEDTTEYGSVDFDKTLTSTAKTAPVTDVNYDGSQDVYITIDDPSQAYTPNADNIAKYLNEYLTQLRQINGINVPVPDANDLMKNWAQSRADEEAQESDSIDHKTKLAYPSGVQIYSEDGHEDSLSTITPTKDGKNLGSDQATAYYLALNWFADYFNIAGSKDDANGLKSFGHAISILSNSGDGMSLGIANGTGKETGGFYAMLEIGSNSNVKNEDGFASTTKDANGNWILTYNGNPVKFLPKTTFHYVTKDYVTKDPNAKSSDNSEQANDPAAGNSGNGVAGNGQDATPVAPQTAEIENMGAGMVSASATASKNDKNLPSTGDSAQTAVTAIGAVMVMAGLGLAAKRKIKEQD